MSDEGVNIILDGVSPRTGLVSDLKEQLREIQLQLSGNSRRSVFMVLRRLVNDDGQSISLTRQQVLSKWPDSVKIDEIEEVIGALVKEDILHEEGSYLNISSNMLASLLNDVLKDDDSEESGLEALVSKKFTAFPSKMQYLTATELESIEPVLSKLILTSDELEFVRKSRHEITRRRTRRWIILILFLTVSSILSAIAVIGWTRANTERNTAKENEKKAQKAREEATRLAERLNEKNITLTAAQDSIKELLKIAADRANTAELAKLRAESAEGEMRAQRDSTLIQKKIAEDNLVKARTAEEQALRDKQEAENQRKEADKQREIANSERMAAQVAQLNAERFRNVLLSTVVADKSLSSPPGRQADTMRAMMARVSYNIENIYGQGDVTNPYIYSALYQGYKRFARSPLFNAEKVGNNAIQELHYSDETNTLDVTSGFKLQTVRFFRDNRNGEYHLADASEDPNNYEQRISKMQFAVNNNVVIAADNSVHVINREENVTSEFVTPKGNKILDVIPFREENEYLVLTSEGDLYKLDVASGDYNTLPGIVDVAHAAYLNRLDLLIYVSRDNQLHLVNFQKDINAHWATLPDLAKLVVHEVNYASGYRIFIVFGYLNGVVRVGVTNDRELLEHDGRITRSMSTARMIEDVLSSTVHKGFITDIDFAEGTDNMIVASGDGTASIWDINKWHQNPSDYQPIILDDHDGWVTACVINRQDNVAFTGTRKGVVKYWPLDPAYFADKICESLDGRSFNPREWDIYVGAGVEYQKQICE